MASLNKVCLIGRLGQTPTVQYSQGGTPVCHLSVATDESYTSKDGERVSRTEWHRVNVFGRQAENCGVYLTKGSLVYVEGSLGTRKWQDKDGNDRYSTEITARFVRFLDSQPKDDTKTFGEDDIQIIDVDNPFSSSNGSNNPMDDGPF